jgi:hypothetical protein
MFNLSDYETVESRLIKFWKAYPDGQIHTEIFEASEHRFIVIARLYRTEADPKPWTTGMAYETIAARGVNATSALENCETSAIGRALANAGFASSGKRASREEMEKVARQSNDAQLVKLEASIAPNNDWTNFVADSSTNNVVPLAAGIEVVTSGFNATIMDERPTCRHGERIVKEGVAKTGKPYRGWMCPNPRTTGSVQCEPIWMILSATTGQWRMPDEK